MSTSRETEGGTTGQANQKTGRWRSEKPRDGHKMVHSSSEEQLSVIGQEMLAKWDKGAVGLSDQMES